MRRRKSVRTTEASSERNDAAREETEGARSTDGWPTDEHEAGDAALDADELLEFMAATPLDVRPDPIFKERLRRELWRFVRTRLGPPRWTLDEGASGSRALKH